MGGFLRSFVHAGRGIGAALDGQRNIRVMLAVAVLALAGGLWCGLSRLEWAAVALAAGLVLTLELMNTAGEKLLDVLAPTPDPRVGRIKDILAGAVLTAAVIASVVGLLVFWPHLNGAG